MTQAKSIEPIDDTDLDDPDTALVEALNQSDRPAAVYRARELALRKLICAAKRAARVVPSKPPEK